MGFSNPIATNELDKGLLVMVRLHFLLYSVLTSVRTLDPLRPRLF